MKKLLPSVNSWVVRQKAIFQRFPWILECHLFLMHTEWAYSKTKSYERNSSSPPQSLFLWPHIWHTSETGVTVADETDKSCQSVWRSSSKSDLSKLHCHQKQFFFGLHSPRWSLCIPDAVISAWHMPNCHIKLTGFELSWQVTKITYMHGSRAPNKQIKPKAFERHFKTSCNVSRLSEEMFLSPSRIWSVWIS